MGELEKLPGYRADRSADIAEAKKLMAAAGLADGIRASTSVSASVAPHAEILAPAFRDELRRTLGIESKIRVMERALLIEGMKKGHLRHDGADGVSLAHRGSLDRAGRCA